MILHHIIYRYVMSSRYNKCFRLIYKLNAHIIFVTKYRKKAINQEIRKRLNVIFKETLDKWECHTMNGKIWGVFSSR